MWTLIVRVEGMHADHCTITTEGPVNFVVNMTKTLWKRDNEFQQWW